MIFIDTPGMRFAALATEDALDTERPLALCLHGFPDTPHTFADLTPRLAEAGYRVVAPFMRGYRPSDAPGDYSTGALGADVIALADALGAEQLDLIGHDWGAITAYVAAAAAPDRIRRMVTAAVPHLGVFRRPTLRQIRRSWYIVRFQRRGKPERWLCAGDMDGIDALWKAWSPGWDYAAEDIAPVKQTLGSPEKLAGPLGYYRVFLRRRRHRRVAVPTLTIAGADDGCVGAEVFAGAERFFDGPYRLVVLPDAGHFMHREQPEAFADEVLAHLKS